MRFVRLLAVFAALFNGSAVMAASRLEAIKARGAVSCAAVPRPGLAMEGAEETKGLFVEICRAVAVAALGDGAKLQFHLLETPKDFAEVEQGAIDVAFLSGAEIVNHKLTAAVAPGPTAFYLTYGLLVEASSPAQTPEDLAGAPICFNQSRGVAPALEDRFARKNLAFVRLGFEEDVELLDAFNSRFCRAALGESTELAMMRLRKGVNRFDSRMLSEPLAVIPLLATTPEGDAQWTRIVAWTVHVLQAAEGVESPWRATGAKALPLSGVDLGLDAAWRENLVAAVGDYGAVYARTFGEISPFRMPRGPNALWSAGGLFAPPGQ